MTRSRLKTEQRLIDAVGALLLEQGYPAVGINAIARQAGCDKVLIYRYFGGYARFAFRSSGAVRLLCRFCWQPDH